MIDTGPHSGGKAIFKPSPWGLLPPVFSAPSCIFAGLIVGRICQVFRRGMMGTRHSARQLLSLTRAAPALPVQPVVFLTFFALAGTPYHRTDREPPVHRKRYRRTSHAGHNKKYQAEAEYRIGKVQRTNRATHPNNQGPCDAGPCAACSIGSDAWRGCREALGGTASGETQITSSQILHLSRGDLQRNQGSQGATYLGCVRPRKPTSCGATTDVGGPGQFRGLSFGEIGIPFRAPGRAHTWRWLRTTG